MGDEQQQQSFLNEQTCWRQTSADRAALLVDGARYYGALRAALLKAQRCVFIVGWDIDSRARIRGASPPRDDAPEELGPFLTHLVEARPDLRVFVLLWDYSVLYATEREPLPTLNLDWRTPAQIKVCLDDQVPIGASQHQKLVVVDDAVAFCGGLDLTIRRWDTCEHLPDNSERTDPDGDIYEPFHDAQMIVDGEAAKALAELVRERWSASAESPALRLEPTGDPWPDEVTADFSGVPVGIARTQAEYDDQPPLQQIQSAYLQSISSAEQLIYIENQYLTVPDIADALVERLRAKTALELVIVNPRLPGGWLEAQTMGIGRQRFLGRLLQDDVAARIRVLYPWTAGDDGECPVMVHTKLMITDDRLLQVGSSNLNRRSMGTDTECDLLLPAKTGAHRNAISAIRKALLAEHLGVTVEALAERERAEGSVIAALEGVDSTNRGLAVLGDLDLAEEPWMDALVDLADPERPIAAEDFVGNMFGAKRIRPLLQRAVKLGLLAVGVGMVLALWRYTPLSEWTDPQRLGPLLADLEASPWVGPAVLGAFLLGSLLAFPVTALVAATAVALGPWSGFGYAFAGCMLGATATYGLGRLLGRQRLEAFLGAWIGKVAHKLRNGGIVPVMVLRNLPIAPFTVVNVIAGSTIRFTDFLLGTALGMAPGVAAVTLLGDRLRRVWEDPNPANVGFVGLALVLWIAVALGLQSWSNRISDR